LLLVINSTVILVLSLTVSEIWPFTAWNVSLHIAAKRLLMET